MKNVFSADVASSLWEKPVLLNDQATKWTKARVNVYWDTIIGKMHDPEDAIKRWNDQVSTVKMRHTFRELQGLDGEPIDFEWKISPGATVLDFLSEIQADLQGKHVTPENFSARIVFMTMFNDIELEKKGNEDSCPITSGKIKDYASKFNDGHWAFLGRGEGSEWYQGFTTNHKVKWDLCASQMVEDFEIQDSRYSRR